MYTRDDVWRAEAILRRIPEFDWLTGNERQWFAVNRIVHGYAMANETVKRLAPKVPGAMQYPGSGRWRIPRSGLMVYFARKVVASRAASIADPTGCE